MPQTIKRSQILVESCEDLSVSDIFIPARNPRFFSHHFPQLYWLVIIGVSQQHLDFVVFLAVVPAQDLYVACKVIYNAPQLGILLLQLLILVDEQLHVSFQLPQLIVQFFIGDWLLDVDRNLDRHLHWHFHSDLSGSGNLDYPLFLDRFLDVDGTINVDGLVQVNRLLYDYWHFNLLLLFPFFIAVTFFLAYQLVLQIKYLLPKSFDFSFMRFIFHVLRNLDDLLRTRQILGHFDTHFHWLLDYNLLNDLVGHFIFQFGYLVVPLLQQTLEKVDIRSELVVVTFDFEQIFLLIPVQPIHIFQIIEFQLQSNSLLFTVCQFFRQLVDLLEQLLQALLIILGLLLDVNFDLFAATRSRCLGFIVEGLKLGVEFKAG